MVAIVSGGTPGLNLGSREVLGQQGVTGHAAHGRRGEGVYVDVARGALVFETTDDQLVGRGADAATVRTYNSTGSFNDDNGDGWSSGVVSLQVVGTVNAAGSSVLRVDRDGSTGTYRFDAARSLYVGTDGGGAYDTIAYVAAAAQFEWRDGATGATQRFEGSGAYRLLASSDPNGNAMTYAYGAAGFLASVTTANGETTLYDYSGSNLAQVRTVADGTTTTRVRYAYDAANRLSRVQVDLTPADNSIADLKVYETFFTYDGDSKRIASMTQGDCTRLDFTYVAVGGAFKVETVTDALGARTRFDYGAGFATVTDALGLVTRYEFDTAGQLTAITAPGGPGAAGTKRFSYDASGNVASVTDGEGRATRFEYDGAGNQVTQRDAPGNTVQRLFDAANRLLTETAYTQPDADGTGPAAPAGPLTSRWIYDTGGRNLLRFALSAAGTVTEYRYDSFGQRVAEITYGAPYPVAGWGPTGSPTEAQMTDWAAQQDRTASRRVDLVYDARGQLQSRTTYAQVNAAGDGIADGTHSVERYVRDRAGLLLQAVSAAGGASTFTYDGLGRVLTSTDALGQVTLTQYDDAHRRTRVTLAHGLVRTSVHDAANRLVAISEASAAGAALGETRYFYDAGGRLRMVQDPTGVRSWTLYDDAGRTVGEIDGNGTLVESSYDRSDRLVRTMRWGGVVNTAALVDASGAPVMGITLAAVRQPFFLPSDQGTWREYDQAGRLVRVAEQSGTLGRATVTETRYDGASRVLEVVRFANTVPADGSAGSVAPGLVPAPAAHAEDRVTRNFHDADGRLAGTLDAEGYLTVFSYNAAGQLTERKAYARATEPALRATGPLAQLVPLASAQDVREVTVYDRQGRAVGQVDGEGYLTESVYDANGNVTRTVRYASAVTAPVTGSSTLGSLRPAPTAADRATERAYDALDRLVQETSAEGVVTRYAYDAGGRLVSTVRAASTEEVRTVLARYDLQGRLTGELSAPGAALLDGAQTQAEVDAIWASHGTSHTYDAASRRTSSTNPLGHRTWFFYDADGALTHTVNALGEVRETRYDARGRASETIAYANRIATAGLAGGLGTPALQAAVAAVANAALDTRAAVTYTRDGKVASETDALGNVRAFTYNAFGDETGVQWTGTGVTQVDTHAVDRRGLRRETIRDTGGIHALESTIHDAFGRAVRIVDANGNVRQQEFDRLGRVVSTRDPLDAVRSTAYDAFDRTLRQTDALGHVTSYAYDAGTRTMRVTTPEGIVTTTTYTRHGQVFSIADGRGQLTRYAYDRAGRLESTTTPLTTQSSAYDAAGRLTETVDANGNKVAYGYDAANRVVTRRVDPAGLDLVTSYAYDGKGQRVAVTDANGVVTTVEYDRKGQVLRQTVDPAGLRLQTSYAYDARGNTLTVTTPGGTVTEYVYDGLGRRVQERVDPAGLNLQRSWGYDREGNVLSSADATGAVTRYAYDGAGRLVFTVDPLGHVQQNSYDAAGRVVKTRTYVTPIATGSLPSAVSPHQVEALLAPVDAQDAVEHRVYDQDGRLAATVDGTGAVVRYAYDAAGNVVARTAFVTRAAGYVAGTMPAPVADNDHDQTVFTVYDAINRPVYTVKMGGATVAMKYDGNGNLLQRTAYARPVGPTPLTEAGLEVAVAAIADPARDACTRNTYDAAGRLVWTVDGAGGVTQRVYDRNSNVVRQVEHAIELPFWAGIGSVVQSANDRTTSMAYDAANRRVMEVDAVGAVTEQVFDAEGRVVRRVAYANPVTALSPSEADRSTRYGYDRAGRLSLVIDATGAIIETGYDDAGRAVSSTARAISVDPASLGTVSSLEAMRKLVRADAADRTSRRAYDAAGRLVYTVDPLGAVQHSAYDGAGRLTRSTRYAMPLGGPTANTAAAIAEAIRADPAKDQSQVFTYNAAGQRLTATDALGAQESYTYDAIGRRLTFTNAKGASWTYEYDAAGRLVRETAPQVAVTTMVDYGTGNISPVTDRAAAGIVTLLTYDALGNLVARTEAVGRREERTTRYEYDGAGRQVRVIYPVVHGYDFGFDPVTGVPGGPLTKAGRQLETVTFYDALGNAVASNDVGGASSHKVYDRMGRVIHELDAMGYVTSYTRDAFGDVRTLTRHATATALAAGTVTHARYAATAAMIEAALTAPGFDRSRDRTLTMMYDRAGRVTETKEGAAYVYDSSGDAGKETDIASRTTRKTYDAFGQLVQESALRNEKMQSWAATTHYFDAVGRETATVDALGYLTRRIYDSTGNLTEHLEYATALAPGWTTSAHGTPPSHADDRRIIYEYDLLNRKTRETRVAIEFSFDTSGTSVRGDATTSFGYDAVGNQTSVADAYGRTTSTYYDALGRVVAVVAPQRFVDGAYVAPLTVFERDAHGNAVKKVEYAGGVNGAPAPGFTPPPTGDADRITLAEYDTLGRAIMTVDALGPNGAPAFTAYDAHGQVARKWQAVTGDDNIAHTWFELNRYDRLGQLVETRTPGSTSALLPDGSIQIVSQAQAGTVASLIEYNAFGEVTRKGEEFFEYDTAGRLWRTNSGDGNVRINLYDLQGNVTAELRSAGSAWGNLDLKAFTSAQEAASNPFIRRTDIRYDLLGRVRGRTEAAREEHQGGVVVRRQFTTAQVLQSATGGFTNWYFSTANATNQVNLSWSSLANLGGGDIKVSIEYLTPKFTQYIDGGWSTRGGSLRTYNSEILNGDQWALWASLTWSDSGVQPSNNFLDVGVASVTRITVHKKDANGYWRTVIDQAPGIGPDEVLVDAPPDPNTAVRLQLRTAGSAGDTGWWDAGMDEFSRAYRFDAAALGAGSYEYRVTVSPPYEPPRVVGTGSFTRSAAGISQAFGQNGDEHWSRPTVWQKTDRWGNVVAITDPRSIYWVTAYRYNASNQLVEQTQPDVTGFFSTASPVTTLHYDKSGRQLAVKDANGNISGRVYDEGGNLVVEKNADGTRVTHAYNAFGERVETTDALLNKTGFAYDKLGRLVRQWKAPTSIYQLGYDLVFYYMGSPQYTERWTYDQLGRKLTQTNGNNETIAYTYDLRGNVIATTQAGGQVTRAAYDAQNRKIAERDPNGKTSTWTYDYFGKLWYHWDLAGRPYDYAYDNAGQMVAQGSGRGQWITYSYDAAGQLTTIRDRVYDKTTSYVYDLSGRKVRERVVQAGITYQDNNMAYDALGRLRDVADARVHMNFDYDKVGNRTRIASSVNFQGTAGEITVPENRYFMYDSMNRQVMVDAVNTSWYLGTQGHYLTYDANGNRASDTYWGTVVVPSATQPGKYEATRGYTTEVYGYDHLDRLQSVRKDGVLIDYRYYDGAGRVTRSGPTGDLNLAYAELINRDLAPGQMNGKETRYNRYDPNGRMVHQSIVRADNSAWSHVSWDRTRSYDAGGGPYTAKGYDEAGNVLGYVVKAYDGSVTEYVTTPIAFDSYQPEVTTGRSSALQPGTLTQTYDVNGHLVSVHDAAQSANNRNFVNDSAGRALYVNQAGRIQRQMIVNGEVLGIYGVGVDPLTPPPAPGGNPNFANIVDFDFGYSRITANYPNATPGAYRVRAGDTLQSIAQSAFGDSSLWYRIAEANGLSSDRDLRIGHTLNIPNRAATVSNNSTTFKPYDPSRITGDLTPTMLPMPQDEKKGCGGVGQLLMIIVAIVATIYTAGAAAGAMGGFTTGSMGVVTASSSVASGFVGTLSAGITALSGGYGVGIAVAAGLVGGAAGSIAGQTVGMRIGARERLNWREVALSAVSGGIAGGFSTAFSAMGPAAQVLRSTATNVVAQGISVAAGLQKSFDWRAVAASAVGAGVGELVGSELRQAWGGNPVGNFAARAVTGLVAGTSAAVMRGGRVAIQQVATDAFGNALGHSFAEGAHGTYTTNSAQVQSSGSKTQGSGPWSDLHYENTMDRQSDVAVLNRKNEPYVQAVLDVFNQRPTPTEEADVLVASLEGLNLGQASAAAAGVPRLSGRGLQLTAGAAGAVAYNSANEYGVEIDYSLIPHDASPRLSTQVGRSARESIWDGVKGIYNSLVVNNLDFIGAGSKLLYERSLFGYALQAGHKMLGLDAPSFDVSPIRAQYRSPYGTLSERATDVAQILGGGYGLLKSFGLGLKSESAVAALTYSSDADASPLSAARRLMSAALGDSGELVRMTNSGVAVIRIGEMTYGQIGGLVVNRGRAAVRNDLAALRDMDPIIGSVQRAGQEIANGATFGKLSPEWRGALDIVRVKYVKEPWIITRLESAALGGYVDRGIGLRIENRLIPEAAGFVKNRIGPDLTKPGLLPIEVTRYTPSLNAIMTHAQRYNQSLAYSLYTKSGLGLKP